MVDIKFSRRHGMQASCLDESRHRFHHFRELRPAILVETLVALASFCQRISQPCLRQIKNVTGEIGCRSLAMEAQRAQAEQQTET